jgi:hypothetical protein
MEDRGVGRISGIAPKTLAGDDDLHRRPAVLHHPNLHGRRVRAQKKIIEALDIERVPVVAGGVIFWHIEGFKVIVIRLDFGAGDDLKAQSDKDIFELFGHLGN